MNLEPTITLNKAWGIHPALKVLMVLLSGPILAGGVYLAFVLGGATGTIGGLLAIAVASLLVILFQGRISIRGNEIASRQDVRRTRGKLDEAVAIESGWDFDRWTAQMFPFFDIVMTSGRVRIYPQFFTGKARAEVEKTLGVIFGMPVRGLARIPARGERIRIALPVVRNGMPPKVANGTTIQAPRF